MFSHGSVYAALAISSSRASPCAFDFSAGSGRFFALYLKLLGLVLVVIALVTGGTALLFPFELANPDELDEEARAHLATFILASLAGIYLMLFLLLGPWFSARVQNLVWNHTTLGPHRLVSDVQARALFWIYLTNFLGILATLGLFKPFPDIRLARHRRETQVPRFRRGAPRADVIRPVEAVAPHVPVQPAGQALEDPARSIFPAHQLHGLVRGHCAPVDRVEIGSPVMPARARQRRP